MENLAFAATRSTPLIRFEAETLHLEIRGESYPENAAHFFGPVFDWVKGILEFAAPQPVVMDLELVYFNSSTSKILFNLFDLMDKAAARGREVTINWHFLEENEMAQECGEEFQNEVRSARFNLVPKPG